MLSLPRSAWTMLIAGILVAASAAAIPVSRLEVRIVTGAEELSAGSSLELRIYEAGKSVRRLPLVNGEGWPRDSTHLIPVKLSDPLDPRSVVRFSLYYRSSSPSSQGLEIVAADVELPSGASPPERLLDTTLSGVISGQGELATTDRNEAALLCKSDADCRAPTTPDTGSPVQFLLPSRSWQRPSPARFGAARATVRAAPLHPRLQLSNIPPQNRNRFGARALRPRRGKC